MFDDEEDEIDWLDAKVDNVTVDGIPLDGRYLEHLIEQIDL